LNAHQRLAHLRARQKPWTRPDPARLNLLGSTDDFTIRTRGSSILSSNRYSGTPSTSGSKTPDFTNSTVLNQKSNVSDRAGKSAVSGPISLRTPFVAELDAIETVAVKPSQQVGFLHNPSELFITRNHGDVNDQGYRNRISGSSIPLAPPGRLGGPYVTPDLISAAGNGQDLAESAYPARDIQSAYHNSNHNYASLPRSPEQLDEVQRERERIRREEVFPLKQRLKKMELSLGTFLDIS